MPTDSSTDRTLVIVCAHDEQHAMASTLTSLRHSFPDARVVVADDASTDATATIAARMGAEVVTAPRNIGKGGAATLAARHARDDLDGSGAAVIILCDADLGDTARHLVDLADVVRAGEADLVVGAFERRLGGGFGVALRFAGWAIRRRCGLTLRAPISGQRALSPQAMRAALPFAPRFGMEIGMTIDVARAGLTVREVDLPLAHRATGRTFAGFLHRGRQLVDFLGVYLRRR